MTKRWLFTLPLIVALCAAWVHGSAPTTVTLGTETIVNPSGASANQYNHNLSVNPNNQNNVVIYMKTGQGSETDSNVFNTTDGMATWAALDVPNWSDPTIQYDTFGNVHLFALDKANGTKLGYRKSTNAGVSFGAGVDITAGAVDHDLATVDLTPASPHYGNIYVSSSASGNIIHVTRSSNSGTSWTDNTLNASGFTPAGGLAGVYGPVVTPNGTLLIPMQVVIQSFPSTSPMEFYVIKSTDGGVTLTTIDIGSFPQPPPTLLEQNGDNMGNIVCGPNGIGGTRCYLTYVQNNASLPNSLLMVYSDDEFVTHSSIITVWAPTGNSQIPSSAATNGVLSVMPMVRSDGVIGIAYFGFALNAGPPSFTGVFDIFFTYSKNYGASGSWVVPIKISSQSSTYLLSQTDGGTQPRSPGQDQVIGQAGPNGTFYVAYQTAYGAATTYTTAVRTITVH